MPFKEIPVNLSNSKPAVLFALAAASVAGLFAAPAKAVVTFQTNVDVHSTQTPPQFISGTGTPIDNFVQDNVGVGQGVSVALKPRNRDPIYGGEPNAVAGNVYLVRPGQSTGNPARPQFVFDYQFDPGTDASTNYILRLDVDFDPTPGVANFSTTQLPIFGGWDASDGYFTSTKRPWNDESVPYVISNTSNLSFLTPPAGAPAYNSNTPGE
jgi:hypothetical protein